MGDLKTISRVVREEVSILAAAPGSWWWVKDDPTAVPWLGCVTQVGSNYVEMTGLNPQYTDSKERQSGRQSARIHDNEFEAMCTPEPDAEAIIAREVEQRRHRTRHLLEQIKDVTARLALNPGVESETAAIAIRSEHTPVKEYKQALVKAQTETLPKLFEQVEQVNAGMARWLKLQLLPMQAQVTPLKKAMGAIESRIFNVELYAGLIEEVHQIADGTPAPTDSPVHVFQRRHYMDEECLVDYHAGGMAFKNLWDFEAWLAEPQHRDRILPFPRTIVAFKVRRHEKEREFPSLSAFINFAFSGEKDLDKLTFLYIRNGDQLYRLQTGVAFDEHLFPDLDRASYDGILYAKVEFEEVKALITEGHYLDKIRAEQDARVKYQEDRKAHATALKAAKAAGLKRGDDGFPWQEPWPEHNWDPASKYEKWTKDSVWYDDIAEYVAKQIEAHNRIVLILQGLLDRSPVLHPHPVWKLWDPVDFTQALVLRYDGSALTSGPPPDFEVYRALLNKTLKAGDVTVGQDDFWARAEAVKLNAKGRRSYSERYYESQHHRPYGNPGPGLLATVVKVGKAGCVYRWERARRTYPRWSDDPTGPIPCTITVPTEKLFNVSAYTPGDFRLFYADPRTRADYLQWAPYLLVAEDYCAGKRKVGER